jgi:hypothetical protein
MGAYPVVDATDYALCLRHVGDLVELVGQITDVKEDLTRYDTPYVFLNFGDWRGKISKIIIWSEALSTFAKHPDSSWIGKWISVTGLLEPPFQKRGYSHIAITITQANQIHKITEKEAKYRIRGEEVPVIKVKTAPKNKEILDGIKGTGTSAPSLSIPVSRPSTVSQPSRSSGRGSKPAPSTPKSRSAPNPGPTISAPLTKNQSVIQSMKSGRPVAVASQSQPLKSQQPKTQQATSQRPATKQVTAKTVIRQKRASLLWIGIGVLLFIPLAVAAFFLPLLLNLPQRIENIQATPTKKPVVTTTSTKSAQVPAAVPTKASECLPWDKITTAAKGEIRCIYGEVSSSRDFLEPGNSYSLVRFRNNQLSFYLIAYDGTLVDVDIGDCLRTEAMVQIDPNGVPFMEPSEISRNKFSCSEQ